MLRYFFGFVMPPSDEGGGFCEAKDGGREYKSPTNLIISLPQSASLTAPSSEGAEKPFVTVETINE